MYIFYATRVAGVTHGNRQGLIANLTGDEGVLITPEPTNEHDPNALAVYTAGHQVGYVPAPLARELAPILAGNPSTGHILQRLGGLSGSQTYGLQIEIRVEIDPVCPLVVHVNSVTWQNAPPWGRVYIGRDWGNWKDLGWGNPFRVGDDGDLTAVLAKYRAHVMARTDLLARLPELRGKVLGCWCRPRGCHGDALAHLVTTKLEPKESRKP
jgi:hypothetical protein